MFTILIILVLLEQPLAEVLPPGTLTELSGGWYQGAAWFH